MTLGVADLFEIGVIDAGFNALPERDHFVVQCHHLTARDFLPHSRSLFSN
jgi:putative hemolysin